MKPKDKEHATHGQELQVLGEEMAGRRAEVNKRRQQAQEEIARCKSKLSTGKKEVMNQRTGLKRRTSELDTLQAKRRLER